jgi:hypothetical protein
MNSDEQTKVQRMKQLEGAATKARLEAMQLAAQVLMKSNDVLAGQSGARHEAELAALKARYQGLVKKAEDAQALVDRLQADEHARKYHR